MNRPYVHTIRSFPESLPKEDRETTGEDSCCPIPCFASLGKQLGNEWEWASHVSELVLTWCVPVLFYAPCYGDVCMGT